MRSSASQYVLGLSGAAEALAISLFQDGKLLFAAEEDKLQGVKRIGLAQLKGRRSAALDAALHSAHASISDIEIVAWVPGASVGAAGDEEALLMHFLEDQYGHAPRMVAVDHWEAHGAFARAVAPGAEAVVMLGTERAVCLSGDAGSLSVRYDERFPLVSFVRTCSEFLGLGNLQSHHLENMARLGAPRHLDQLRELLNGDPARTSLWTALSRLTGLNRRLESEKLSKAHFDLAASAQSLLEEGAGALVELVRGTPADRRTVALTGGVFQNWRLNDALAAQFPTASFSVSFAPGNSGCAIGGPLVYFGAAADGQRIASPFLGPSYTCEQIKQVLDNCKAIYGWYPAPEVLDITCDALANGLMVGWFSGRCEFGSKALGARSTFANPASPYACDNLNQYLKKRPAYMSYGVSMAREASARVFDGESPYMLRSTRIPEYFGDADVRLQTVCQSLTPHLHSLLERFGAKTGVPALLNTSLNYSGEPMACDPRDALKAFFASGLDLLVMDHFVIAKR
jgi:carbamoyltransferase